MKYISFIVVIFFLFYGYAYSIWRGEKQYLFQNKITGEYKNTYQMLYRIDYDFFRNSLEKYIWDIDFPNNSVFQDWNIVAYKLCDREVCSYKWNKELFTQPTSEIISSDFVFLEQVKIFGYGTITSFILKIFLLFIILVLFLIWKLRSTK